MIYALALMASALAWWRSAAASPYTADVGWLFSSAVLVAAALCGVRYWPNMRLEAVPLSGRLEGLRASTNETDVLASRIANGEMPRTLNVLAYFAADVLPPHRYLHPEELLGAKP